MPIYEYKCEQCGEQSEKLQKISDPPAQTCPECGQDSLKKLVSAAAFKLKGTGWYETDFKDKKPKATDKSTNTSKDSTEKKGADKAKAPAKVANNSSNSGSKSASSE